MPILQNQFAHEIKLYEFKLNLVSTLSVEREFGRAYFVRIQLALTNISSM